MAREKTSALLAAAGRGERLGFDRPKAFVPLGNRPLLSYSLETLRRSPAIDEIVLILPPEQGEAGRRLLAESLSDKTEKLILGGAHRQESVANGLQEVAADCDLVLIHDAARPFLTEAMISASLEMARRDGASAIGRPASDTIKQAEADGWVRRTLDRSDLWTIQTPQAFRYSLICEAHAQAKQEGFLATDDTALVEHLGHRVRLVEGSAGNIKITTPEDLQLAERMLGMGAGIPEFRFGFGYDVHRLVEGRPLILGGVEFPFPVGLLGHSDADVLSHAVGDALLGAAGAGDLGRLFPDTDPQYAGISSLVLLERIAGRVRELGYEIVNIDVVVAAQAPKLAKRGKEVTAALGKALRVDDARISVKATTTDQLGFVGAGEGIATYAVCSLRKYGEAAPQAQSSQGSSFQSQQGE